MMLLHRLVLSLASLPLTFVSGVVAPSTFAFEAPGPTWPAATADLSDAAWASKAQPPLFAAWPSDAGGKPLPCAAGTTVLKDTATDWPGLCLGLKKVTGIEDADVCRKSCVVNVGCSVWQYIAVVDGCYQGIGHNCLTRDGGQEDIVVQAAQRLQHGDVRLLRGMADFSIDRLRSLGVQNEGNTTTGIAHCRASCYSDIYCQYWQYRGDGCWVEDQQHQAELPLTTATALGFAMTSSASTISAGEYIQHVCMAAGTAPRVAVAALGSGADSSKFSPTHFIVAGGILAVLGFGGILAYLLLDWGGRVRSPVLRNTGL